jgi:pSer/pThr/pTyr-binding forkhead associated (FHA) protein
MPKFVVRIAAQSTASFSVDEDDIFLGRVPSINDICISDPSVSRQHAHIKKGDDGYTIYDLKSLNGVLLNGTKVEKGALRDGDVIRLGDVEITFELSPSSEEKGADEITKASKSIKKIS